MLCFDEKNISTEERSKVDIERGMRRTPSILLMIMQFCLDINQFQGYISFRRFQNTSTSIVFKNNVFGEKKLRYDICHLCYTHVIILIQGQFEAIYSFIGGVIINRPEIASLSNMYNVLYCRSNALGC